MAYESVFKPLHKPSPQISFALYFGLSEWRSSNTWGYLYGKHTRACLRRGTQGTHSPALRCCAEPLLWRTACCWASPNARGGLFTLNNWRGHFKCFTGMASRDSSPAERGLISRNVCFTQAGEPQNLILTSLPSVGSGRSLHLSLTSLRSPWASFFSRLHGKPC